MIKIDNFIYKFCYYLIQIFNYCFLAVPNPFKLELKYKFEMFLHLYLMPA